MYCRDLDSQYDWNEDPDLSIEVKCLDLTINSLCQDLKKNILQVNRTDSIQTIPKLSVQTYSIQTWQVTAKKQNMSYTFRQNVVFLDNDFSILDMNYSKGYQMRPINNYESLQFIFNIPFDYRQSLVEYQVAIIYDFELVKLLSPQYFQFQFRLFDCYQDFNKGNIFNLKFVTQYSFDIIPSQQDLQLTLNQPPICRGQLDNYKPFALTQLKFVGNCQYSDDSPYIYQFRFFLTNKDYEDFNKGISDYSLILFSYQSSNIFEVYLPASNAIALIQVMDQRGSISNMKFEINSTKTDINCTSLQNGTFELKYQIALTLEIILNHYDQENCPVQVKQLMSKIKSQIYQFEFNDQMLAYQIIKIQAKLMLQQTNNKSQSRLLNQVDLINCYDNQTQKFIIKSPQINEQITYNSSILNEDLQKIKSGIKKLILQKINLEVEINNNPLFLDEKLSQQQESIINSILSQLYLIDDMFSTLQNISVKSEFEKSMLYNITTELLLLIDKISNQICTKAKVNEAQLMINGSNLNLNIARITKPVFNSLFNIIGDTTDMLIAFLQRNALQVNYNYYYLSQQEQIPQISTLLNQSNVTIDRNYYFKTQLQNYLYSDRVIQYDTLIKDYLIDITEYKYCLDESYKQDDIVNYFCVNRDYNKQFHKCEILIEEKDNTTIQISCKCQQLGEIFLIRSMNLISDDQNNTIIYNDLHNNNNKDITLTNQPILLFQGIFIAFSFFLYFELIFIDIRRKITKDIKYNNIDTTDDINKLEKKNCVILYPGLIFLFKENFKYIHSVIQLFYYHDCHIDSSYKFLQLSTSINILLPLVFLEIILLKDLAISIGIFILNQGIILILKLIFKIFQAIYRFKGKCAISIILIYFIMNMISYIMLILLILRNINSDFSINKDVFIIFSSSILFALFIIEPLMIIIRIELYKITIGGIQNRTLNPIEHLLFFFVQHSKLDEIFEQYVFL